MMELGAILNILETYGPLGLLAVALTILAWAQVKTSRSVLRFTGNDLRHISEALQRIETSLSAIERRAEDIWDKLRD